LGAAADIMMLWFSSVSLGDIMGQCLEIDYDHSLLHLGSWIVIILSCILALSKCCSWYSI